MGKSLLDLANRCDKLAAEIEEAGNQTAIAVSVATISHLAFNTPVDTSQALSNYIVTLDNPASGTRSAFVPGMFGSTQYASAQQTIAAAVAVVTKKKPGQAVYIVNNLDYIVALNEGTISRQPGGFVEGALLAGRLEVKKFKLRS